MNHLITLNQVAFQRLITYLHSIQSPILDIIQPYANDCYYFKAFFQTNNGIILGVFNKLNDTPVIEQHLTWDNQIDMSLIEDILFHAEQRVADYN